MKKQIGLLMICLQLLLAVSATFLVSAENTYTPIIMNFEDAGTQTATQYLTAKGWTSAGNGLSIVGEPGSKRLKMDKGSTIANKINFVSNNLYSPTTYPNTKFVMEFTQHVEEINTSLPTILISSNMPWVIGKKSDNTTKVFFRGQLSKDYKLSHSNILLQDGAWQKVQADYTNKKDMHFTQVINFSEGNQTTYVNGASGAPLDWLRGDALSAISSINDIAFETNPGNTIYYDDIKFYAVNNTFSMNSSPLNGASDVAINSDLLFSFNNPVLADSLSGIVLTANNQVIDASQYTVKLVADEFSLNKQVRITLHNKLAFNTAYTINFPSQFKDVARQTLGMPETISFTTMTKPDFSITSFVCKKGLSESGIVYPTMQEANGLVNCNVTVKNNGSRAEKATVFIGLYQNGKIIDFGYASKEFAVNATDTITSYFHIPEDKTGLEIKAFICAGLGNLTFFSDVRTMQ